MRAAGPYLRAVDLPAALHPLPTRAQCGEVRPGVGLGHTDAEVGLARADLRQEVAALLLRAEPQQGRHDLTVSHPVRRDGCARSEHLLDDDVAVSGGPPWAAVLLRHRHADPAMAGHPLGEGLVPLRQPRVAMRLEATSLELLGQERPDILA